MKKLVVALLAIASLGALVLSAGSASAAFEWLCAGEKVTGTGEERCLVLSENLETLVLEDMGVPASVSCPPEAVLNEGWVGPGAAAETTAVTFTGCVRSANAENLKNEVTGNACEAGKAVTVEALNLPWSTPIEELELEAEVNMYWILIKPGASGKAPGYEVKCTVAGLKVSDKCETGAETALVLAFNLTEVEEPEKLLLVSIFFNKKVLTETEQGTCSVGGKENGLLIGEVLLIGETHNNSALLSLEING